MTFSGGSCVKEEEGFFSDLLSKAVYPNGIKHDECRCLNMGTFALYFTILHSFYPLMYPQLTESV